ncbi:hypothetical protein MtrunA17_Chr7g0268841 [Medicago truncatula]|uniref:Transmembrane protein n=2 Tax=Medicago truncatula TaxID=3880 RepID=A0A396H833_MEDTR|nr:hypothetical protein MtrunA17_Chr7g0268841 [Medicago truncatula]
MKRGGRSCSGAVVGRSAAAPDFFFFAFFRIFLHQNTPFPFLYPNPNSKFRKHTPKILDLQMKVWKFYLFFRSPSFLAFPVRFSCFPLLRFGCSSLFRFGAGFFVPVRRKLFLFRFGSGFLLRFVSLCFRSVWMMICVYGLI